MHHDRRALAAAKPRKRRVVRIHIKLVVDELQPRRDRGRGRTAVHAIGEVGRVQVVVVQIRRPREQLHPLCPAPARDARRQRLGHRRRVVRRRRGGPKYGHRVGLRHRAAKPVGDGVGHHDRFAVPARDPGKRRVVRVDQDLVAGDLDTCGHRRARGRAIDAVGHVLHVQRVAIEVCRARKQLFKQRLATALHRRVQRCGHRGRMVVHHRRVAGRRLDRDRVGLCKLAAVPVADRVVRDDRLRVASAHPGERRAVRIDRQRGTDQRHARRHTGRSRSAVDAEGQVRERKRRRCRILVQDPRKQVLEDGLRRPPDHRRLQRALGLQTVPRHHVVGQDGDADVARRVCVGDRQGVRPAGVQRQHLTPATVAVHRVRIKQPAVLEDLYRRAPLAVAHQRLALRADDPHGRRNDAHVRGDRVHGDRTDGTAHRDVAGHVGRVHDDVGRTLVYARMHRVGGRVIIAAVIDHRRVLAVDRDAGDDVSRREGPGNDIARLGQQVAVGVVRGFRGSVHGHRRRDRVDRDVALERERCDVARFVVRDDLDTRQGIHIIRLDGVSRRVMVTQAVVDRCGIAVDRDAVHKNRHARDFRIQRERLSDDIARAGPGRVRVVGGIRNLRDRGRQRVNRDRATEGDYIGVARIVVQVHDHVGQAARVSDQGRALKAINVRAESNRIGHKRRNRLTVDRGTVDRDANTRRGRSNREIAANRVARGCHRDVKHVVRLFGNAEGRGQGGRHRHRACDGIDRHVACGIVRGNHHASETARITREHRVGRRVIATTQRVHRRCLAVDHDTIDGVGRSGGEGFGDDVARLGERCAVVVVRSFATVDNSRCDRIHDHAAAIRCDRDVARSVMRGDHNARSAIGIVRQHRVGGRVIVARAVVHRGRVAIDRDARDRIGRRKRLGNDVTRLGQCRGCVVRDFAREMNNRRHRINSHSARCRDGGRVACCVRGCNRYAGRSVGVARLYRVGRGVVVARAVVHRRRVAVDQNARDRVGGGNGFGDDVARLGERRRCVVRGLADRGDDRSDGVHRHAARVRHRGHVARGIR